MRTTKTFEEIFEFIAIAQQWMMKDKGANAESKLGYAIQKVMGRLKRAQKKYNARVEEIQIDTCLADEKGKILKDERGNLEYTKEGIKERNSKVQELGEQTFEVESYMARVLPKKANDEIDLSYAELESFDGFVLVKSPEPEEPQPQDTPVEQPSVS